MKFVYTTPMHDGNSYFNNYYTIDCKDMNEAIVKKNALNISFELNKEMGITPFICGEVKIITLDEWFETRLCG